MNKDIFETFVFWKVITIEIFVANLALYHYFWTFSFDMLKQLSSSHVLEVLMITNVASKLRAVKHCMFLKLFHCFPDNFSTFWPLIASMRKFTEINTIPKNFIDILKEVTSFLTIWAANIVIWSFLPLRFLLKHFHITFPFILWHRLKSSFNFWIIKIRFFKCRLNILL